MFRTILNRACPALRPVGAALVGLQAAAAWAIAPQSYTGKAAAPMAVWSSSHSVRSDAPATALKPGESRALTAGPLHVKFQDGELRYLYVGNREIARRIYFAVRNGRWATSTPVFRKMALHEARGGFTIELEADCTAEGVDYHWKGHIVGEVDGKITFSAEGVSGGSFSSNRIGLCVLYGAPALAGHPYEVSQTGAAAKAGVFPPLVSPALVEPQFNTLRYTAADGLSVTTTLTGTRFDMEDQRTYGDSSFKAYAPLTYPYPNIPANAPAQESVTVQVAHVPADRGPKVGTTGVSLGALERGARIPAIVIQAESHTGGIFGAVNNQQAKYQNADALTWAFTPSIHLLDDDAFLENAWALPDQVRTAHAYAPGAAITIDPIVLNSRPGPAGDSRGAGAFGAAWSAIVVKELALAGVGEAHFALGPGQGATLLKELVGYAGKPIYATPIVCATGAPPPIDALAIETDGGPVAYLINRTDREQQVKWEGRGHKAVELILAAYAVVKAPTAPK